MCRGIRMRFNLRGARRESNSYVPSLSLINYIRLYLYSSVRGCNVARLSALLFHSYSNSAAVVFLITPLNDNT